MAHGEFKGIQRPRIVIIGGGISGLTAASMLTKMNCFDVTVLEARDRLGGRIKTESMHDGAKVDLGASWIHGIGPNVLGDEDKGFWRG